MKTTSVTVQSLLLCLFLLSACSNKAEKRLPKSMSDNEFVYKFGKPSNESTLRQTITYNEQGRPVEINGNYEKNQKQYPYGETIRYDDKGNETEYLSYDPDGKLNYKSRLKYFFNSEGNISEECVIGPPLDDTISRTKMFYNKKSKLELKVISYTGPEFFDVGDDCDRIDTIQYNANGDISDIEQFVEHTQSMRKLMPVSEYMLKHYSLIRLRRIDYSYDKDKHLTEITTKTTYRNTIDYVLKVEQYFYNDDNLLYLKKEFQNVLIRETFYNKYGLEEKIINYDQYSGEPISEDRIVYQYW